MVSEAQYSPDVRIAEANHETRVLHIVEAFGGGVQTALHQYLDNADFAVHKIVARQREGHSVGVLASADLEIFDGSLAGFAKLSNKVLGTFQPQVVHLHSSYSSLMRLLPACANRKLVYSPHCFAFERADKNFFERTLYRWVEQCLHNIRPAELAAVSPYEANLAAEALKLQDVTLLPNVVREPTHPRTTSRKQGPQTQPRRVVGVGRITAQKSPEFFAAVAHRLRDKQIEFVWVGDGDPSLRRVLEHAGVDVLGWQDNFATKQIVRSAELYLHTASWEGAPIAPLEATEVGVPVIARKIASLEGLGYFTPGTTVKSVSDAVEKFFESTAFAEKVRHTDHLRATTYCPSFQNAALRRLYSAGSEKIEMM
ncbi:glycosyltransferase family 4 protein [Rhodococcus rhodochrous]|uniref:glycosyltransferase family 4 protein n=1 Tax=Rhodococcus rhodochrous TaxID=1829 RepID=UPI0009BD6D9F|nr:glycosyltransferase family 4 protein [Rhodococcus rhodochrous]